LSSDLTHSCDTDGNVGKFMSSVRKEVFGSEPDSEKTPLNVDKEVWSLGDIYCKVCRLRSFVRCGMPPNQGRKKAVISQQKKM
jgi:hypothetical protein